MFFLSSSPPLMEFPSPPKPFDIASLRFLFSSSFLSIRCLLFFSLLLFPRFHLLVHCGFFISQVFSPRLYYQHPFPTLFLFCPPHTLVQFSHRVFGFFLTKVLRHPFKVWNLLSSCSFFPLLFPSPFFFSKAIIYPSFFPPPGVHPPFS